MSKIEKLDDFHLTIAEIKKKRLSAIKSADGSRLCQLGVLGQRPPFTP